jgi:hypothetical protein
VLARRFPLLEVDVLPVPVQGETAAAQITRDAAARRASGRYDVVLLARGGGSLEDLWAFNDEALARAIAASPVPVVSAVGHETDFTLADFAADLRAPTPSVAAELLVPDRRDLLARLHGLHRHACRRCADARNPCSPATCSTRRCACAGWRVRCMRSARWPRSRAATASCSARMAAWSAASAMRHRGEALRRACTTAACACAWKATESGS